MSEPTPARPSPAAPPLAAILRLVQVERDELAAVLASFGYHFCILSSYYVLRPVRDALGAREFQDLPWFFTATFLAMLAFVPVFGFVSSRFRRSVFIPWVYVIAALAIVGFYLGLTAYPDSSALAGTFFVFLSVYNLIVVSVFWSVMADYYTAKQGKRLFGFIAAGGSAGALLGPLISATVVTRFDYEKLFLISAAILAVAVVFFRILLARSPVDHEGADRIRTARPLGGNPFAGLGLVARSPYLMLIVGFMVLFTTIATFLYFQMADLTRQAFDTTEARTQFFAWRDLAVNTISFTMQFFLTGRIVRRFGVGVALSIVPLFIAAGMSALALAPTLWVIFFVEVGRRAGNFSIMRPAREMLYTVVDPEAKYKAKNVIDTLVYRGGDAMSGWAYAGLAAIGFTLSGIAWIGAALAVGLGAVGLLLGRRFAARESGAAPAAEPGPAVAEPR